MAQLTFSELQEKVSNSNNTNFNKPRVGYFQLKNDNDEALVRIMHDSTDDFDLVTGHTIPQGNSFPFINCIRNAKDALEVCPLCASGSKLEKKIYIHLIEYVEKDGKRYANPKVFARTLKYANKISSLIDTYGPLSNLVCKIVRHGKAGVKDVSYEILPLPANAVYSEENYPKHPEYFENYKAVGNAVYDKTYEELVALAEGKDTTSVATPKQVNYQQPAAQQTPQYNEKPQWQSTPSTITPTHSFVEPQTQQVEEPRRSFNTVQGNFNLNRPKRI